MYGTAEGYERRREYFEYCATGIVLVGRLDVASANMGSRYFIKGRLCLYKSVGKKCEERLERGYWVVAAQG